MKPHGVNNVPLERVDSSSDLPCGEAAETGTEQVVLDRKLEQVGL